MKISNVELIVKRNKLILIAKSVQETKNSVKIF